MVKKGSKICCYISLSMPQPVSVTEMQKYRPGCADKPYNLSFFNLVSMLDQYFIQVEIHAEDTSTVI